MKTIIIAIFCSIVALNAAGQTQRGDTALVRQAREVVKTKDYSKALQLFLKADATFAPDTTDYYGNLQHNIGYCYYMMDDKRNAAAYWEKALKVFPQFSDKNGQMLEFLAGIYDDLGDADNLLRIMELTQAHNEYELTKPYVTMQDYIDRAQYCDVTGDAARAKSIFLEALEKVGTATPAEQEDVYAAYAKYLGDRDDRHGAAEYYTLAAKAREATDKGRDVEWAKAMRLAALHYRINREWQAAYDAYEEANKVFSSCGEKKLANDCVSGMGTCKYFQREYDEAKALYEQTRKALETDKQTADYAKALEDVAKADVRLKRFDEAIDYLQQAVDIYESLGDNTKLQSVLTDLNRAKVKAGQGYDATIEASAQAAAEAQSRKILAEERESEPLYKLQYGEDGLEYVRSLGLVAGLTYALEDKDEGVALYEDFLGKYRKALRKSFVLQDEEERQRTWQEETMTLDSLVAHTFGYDSTTMHLSARLNALAYDVQLLSKGVLLNSSIEFEQVVENYGDQQLKADYDRIKSLNKEIERLQASGGTEAGLEQLAQLRQESDRLMLGLMQRCKEMSDFTEYLDYTWQDVQQALGEKDVAIEFAEIKNGVPSSNNVLMALILTKALPAPLALPICLRWHAAVMAQDSLVYSNDNYGNLVWGNLLPLLGGFEKVYFSPTAEIANLGIEYLRYQGKPVIDHMEMYRLSSTKELCRAHQPLSLAQVALFGGIDYDAGGQTASAQRTKVGERSGEETDGVSGSLDFGPLAGTEKEVREIGKLLKSTKAGKGKLYVGAAASEHTLRGLSGDGQLDALHIATHGRYVGTSKTTENEAMQYSMLAFSGVNAPIEDANEDGFVTAQDIAAMNLRHCGMAVLSACETGLGKLGSDGVFGLQRGFKNAGVHTLLMSINKVNDAATTELMIQFYKALAQGNVSPNAALRQAQRHLRDNGYADPRLWANFIILDGQ